ncbi:LysM domain-containing protein [Polyangium sp. 15x6]|uniref:LysM peptidoglycan-binding domain-containing protein n=1 Tax=Polyangium sp. 15x6 TaxID=3042687 RepID=UPI00249AFAA9|nr:LysM domain-containing protein [Polyangium sp. 15x6]MDI3283836.1 LysM domain-containing protein [Polyangium sp. 15x6]
MQRFFVSMLALALVPLATAAAAPKDPKAGLAYYERPSTLSHVAAKFGIPVDEIARLNGIKDKDRFHRYGIVLPDVPSTRKLPRYVPWAPARPRAMCAVTSWKLVAAQEKGCTEAYCGTGPGGGRACLCRDDQAETTMSLTTNGKTLRWPASISMWNPWGSSFVDVTSADLDGDGSPEVMLSTLGAVSNGLGQEYREFIVVRDGREWFRYDSGTFTAKTALVRVGNECHLASAHWEEVTHPLKGPALHLVERTFDPTNLRVDREMVGIRAGEGQAYELPFDPLAPRTLPTQSGTVVAISRVDVGTTIKIRTDAGTKTLPDARFGDASTGRVLPFGFLPSKGSVGKGKVLFGRSHDTDIVWLPGAKQR